MNLTMWILILMALIPFIIFIIMTVKTIKFAKQRKKEFASSSPVEVQTSKASKKNRKTEETFLVVMLMSACIPSLVGIIGAIFLIGAYILMFSDPLQTGSTEFYLSVLSMVINAAGTCLIFYITTVSIRKGITVKRFAVMYILAYIPQIISVELLIRLVLITLRV